MPSIIFRECRVPTQCHLAAWRSDPPPLPILQVPLKTTERRRLDADNLLRGTNVQECVCPSSPSPSPPPLVPSPPPPPVPYTFTNKDALMTAVNAVNANPASALATYGPVADWDVSGVSDMSRLFYYLQNFDEDVSSWDTSSVTNMFAMFSVRAAHALAPSAFIAWRPLPVHAACALPPAHAPLAPAHTLLRIARPCFQLGRARRRSTSRSASTRPASRT